MKQALKDCLLLAAFPLSITLALGAGIYCSSPASSAVRGVSPGTATALNPTQIISSGTATPTGCALTAPSNTAPSGKYTSGTSGTCTVTLTMPASKTGYMCIGSDTSTGALQPQSGLGTTTTCVISGATTSGDVVTYVAIGF